MLLARAGAPGRCFWTGQVRHRHALDARPDARRRAPAVPLGPARRGSSRPARRRSGGDVPLRRGRPGPGLDPAEPRRGRALRPAPLRARPGARRRRRRGRRRRAATRPGSPTCSATARAAWPGSGSVDGSGTRRPLGRVSWSVPTGSGRWWPDEVGAAVLKQGRWATRRPVRLRTGTPAEPGYEWAYGNGAAAGHHPDQRRAQLRLRRHHARADARAAARCGRRATRSTPSSRSRRRGSADRLERRHPGRPPAGLGGRPGLRPPARGGRAGRSSGTRGTSRTRSARTGSPTPCATRSCWPARSSRRCRGPGPRASPWPATRPTRDRLSAHLFQVSDEIAAYDWDITRGPAGLLRRVSAAMTDEVEYLESLPSWQPAPVGRRKSTADAVARR